MIPILFDANEKDFSTRGLGPLSDAVSCKVVEERNGSYELTMKYPKNGIHFEDIGLNKIIFAIPSPYRDAQPFRIYKMSTPMNGAVTIYAQHISYDLSGVSVLPFTGISVTDIFDKIKSNSINRNDFDFVGNSDFSTECVYDIPHTARQILGGIDGSVIDRFGGEYEFDKFTVRWNLNRGANNGVTVRYGKNLLTLNQDVDISQIVTGVIPYWANMEGGTAIVGDRVNLDGEYTFERIIPLDLSQEFENEPSKEDLEARAKTYIDANYSLEPEINCTVSFALIEQYEDYKEYKLLEKCDLCDVVTVQYPDLGINSTAKIVKIDTDVLKDRYNSVTLGSVRANIAQTIVAQQKAVEDVPTRKDVSGIVQGSLGNILGAQGGSIRLLDTNNDGQPDTLYIADNSNPIEAKKVWRFNYLGWAASENGYNGPFKMGATLDDGLLADFVTAANLVAGTIKSADDGVSFSLDLSTGHINAKKLSWDSEYSDMSEDGKLTCGDVTISGQLFAGNREIPYDRNNLPGINRFTGNTSITDSGYIVNVRILDQEGGSGNDTYYMVIGDGSIRGGAIEKNGNFKETGRIRFSELNGEYVFEGDIGEWVSYEYSELVCTSELTISGKPIYLKGDLNINDVSSIYTDDGTVLHHNKTEAYSGDIYVDGYRLTFKNGLLFDAFYEMVVE